MFPFTFNGFNASSAFTGGQQQTQQSSFYTNQQQRQQSQLPMQMVMSTNELGALAGLPMSLLLGGTGTADSQSTIVPAVAGLPTLGFGSVGQSLLAPLPGTAPFRLFDANTNFMNLEDMIRWQQLQLDYQHQRQRIAIMTAMNQQRQMLPTMISEPTLALAKAQTQYQDADDSLSQTELIPELCPVPSSSASNTTNSRTRTTEPKRTRKVSKRSIAGYGSVSPSNRRRLCSHDGCKKLCQGRSNFCFAHGGGYRCSKQGCSAAARGKAPFCIKHGGGFRCEVDDCPNAARGKLRLCIAHGGGRRCNTDGCSNASQSTQGLCKRHLREQKLTRLAIQQQSPLV